MEATKGHLTFRSALAFLVAAGDGGATTTEMAQAFGKPGTHQKRSNRVSQIMRELTGQGYTEKTGTEPSPLYRNTPVSRWRATPAGVSRHEAAVQAGSRRAVLDEEMEGHAERRQDAMAAAYAETARRFASGLGMTRCYRRAKILELRTVPCTLAEIGELFGLGRERTRQIEMGLERPCACRECVTALCWAVRGGESWNGVGDVMPSGRIRAGARPAPASPVLPPPFPA
jgi:hypothetical protein